MSSAELPPVAHDHPIDGSQLVAALSEDRFKQFLDQIPIAVAVAELEPAELVVYANHEFERLSGQLNARVLGHPWSALPGAGETQPSQGLGEAVTEGADYIGAFLMPREGDEIRVDAWSTLIADEAGKPAFRLVALVVASAREPSVLEQLEDQVREKDVQLQELQHRVRNNLQMITALIRIEARGVSDLSTGEGFDRLAGRVEALGILYRALGDAPAKSEVDLGIYLSEIASAAMRAHGTEGIRLDVLVDTWFVPLDVAMPTGLVVNELMTNTLKHAFRGREGGSIRLRCTADGNGGCNVLVADDGVGLPAGYVWPKAGKLSALIVRSLLQNAQVRLNVTSEPGHGMQVDILFASPAGLSR